MKKKITSALISVYYKDGLEHILSELQRLEIKIYSTGGTQKFIEDAGYTCTAVESLTGYPSILGGRVKTLHPAVFGGILYRRSKMQDQQEMNHHNIPVMDLVIVDLYPFEETLSEQLELAVKTNTQLNESLIIEKIDIGGPSIIRAAAKNHKDVVVIAAKNQYDSFVSILQKQNGETSLEQRRSFAAQAFEIVKDYDTAISNYFTNNSARVSTEKVLRYGENPHQQATFKGDLTKIFTQLHGKELSYNNLVDTEAAILLINDFAKDAGKNLNNEVIFAIIKHTNVCGIAQRSTVKNSWDAALAGDPESAFGGVLITNGSIDKEAAEAIHEIFFEVLVAPAFHPDALTILQSKKNRILLEYDGNKHAGSGIFKSLLNGVLHQDMDMGNFAEWNETGGRESTPNEKADLVFSNIVCKHLKSNAIALVKNKQLVGKGCGQTSRIDALRQSIEKAKQFDFNLQHAVLASDAFFPFDDCVKMAHAEGIQAFIQPGGSIRDKDSIAYCKANNLAMVFTGLRHFRH